MAGGLRTRSSMADHTDEETIRLLNTAIQTDRGLEVSLSLCSFCACSVQAQKQLESCPAFELLVSRPIGPLYMRVGCACVRVCVCERERERESVCVYAYVFIHV